MVHNRYRSVQPSGENSVVDSDVESLRADGVEVVPYFCESDSIESMSTMQRALLGIRPVHSFGDVSAMAHLLETVRPDVVHVHNVYPLISPSVVRLAARRGVAVVQTVHNFRHRCVSGVDFRDGAVCTDCHRRRLAWPAVLHGCYQQSVARSVPMAASLAVHRSTWHLVDRFLACGDHLADFLVETGIDASRIEVRRNTLPDPGEPAPLGDSVLFVGRLVEEKGVRHVLAAWSLASMAVGSARLRIAGDGPLRDEVVAAAATDPSIEYLGLLDPAALGEVYRAARLVVVPSLWPEPDPITVVAALAHGRPLLATSIGSIPRSMGDESGWCTAPTVEAIAKGLRDALRAGPELVAAGIAARRRYLDLRRPEAVRPLVEVYREVLNARAGDRRAG